MRIFYFLAAVVFCIAAIVLRAWTGSPALPVVAIIGAGLFLVLGFSTHSGDTPGRDRPLELSDVDEKKRQTIRDLLDQGHYGTAVKQVRLWFRHVDQEGAEEVVQQLARP
ncbi:hypothetical protein VVR26_06610 [Corynebacterium camporealensis]|uniref:hypothetical protein n=1 Tax=Corynebacterium camporealensis TaxID=161896 RepID=UPI0034D010CC